MEHSSDDDFSKIADTSKRDQMKEHCKIQFSAKALYTVEPQEIGIRSVEFYNKNSTEYFKYEIVTFKGEIIPFEKRYAEFEAFHLELVKTISDPYRESPYGASLHSLPVLPDKHIDKKVKENLENRQEELRIYSLQVLLHRGLSALKLTHEFFIGAGGPKAPGFFWRAISGIGRAANGVTGLVMNVIGQGPDSKSVTEPKNNLARVQKLVDEHTNTIEFLRSTMELYEGKQQLYHIVQGHILDDQTSLHLSFQNVNDPYNEHLHSLRASIKHLEIVKKQFLALVQSYIIYEEAKQRLKAETQQDENQYASEALLNKKVLALKSFLRHSRLVLREEFEIINEHTKSDLLYIMKVVDDSIKALTQVGDSL
jgi:PX domain